MAGGLGGIPLPDDRPDLPDGRIEIAYAATDDVVVIGSGPDFVKHVLDAGAGASLADDDRYKALVGRVGAAQRGSASSTSPRSAASSRARSGARRRGARGVRGDVKPFLAPFDAFVAARRHRRRSTSSTPSSRSSSRPGAPSPAPSHRKEHTATWQSASG